MSKSLAVDSNFVDHTDVNLERQAALAFGERLQRRAREMRRTSTEIARSAGIKRGAMTGYWNGERIPPANKLFSIADYLEMDARFLASGVRVRAPGTLVDVAEADFVNLPRYDLREISETDKGRSVDSVPFRRDWLNRRLLVSSGLWLTEVPSDYDMLGMAEGDIVVCSDIGADGPQNNWTCFFKDAYGVFAARFSHNGDGAGWRLGHVTAQNVAERDVFPVARIHARIFAKL